MSATRHVPDRAFVTELCRRTGAAGRQTLFQAGSPPVIYWLGAVVFVGASLALAGSAIGIAAGRTVSNARRLGRRSDSTGEQGRLARSICRDHLVCFAAIATTIALQLIFAT